MSVLIIIQNHAEFFNTLIRTLMRSKDNVTIFGLIKDCCICVHMHCKLLEKNEDIINSIHVCHGDNRQLHLGKKITKMTLV